MRNLSAIGLVWLLAACGSDGDGSGADGGDRDGASGSDAMPVGDASADGWATLPNVGGGPIQEIGVAALGGKIYVVGGFTGGGAIVDTVRVYDIAAQMWGTTAPLPAAVHHANVAAAGGKLYVLGALQTIGFNAIDNVWSYDPATDMWSPEAPMPAGTERGASAVGVVNGDICLAGGFRSGSVDDFSCYDPVGDSWTVLPAVPTANDHLVGGVVNDRFFIIGGRAGGIAGIFDEVYEWVPAGAEWQARAPMPTARGGGAAGVVNGAILVVGGEGNAAVSSGVFPQVESYDPVGDTWTPLGEMRSPRHGMGAAGVGDTLYIPGGADEQAFAAVDTFESFTP